MATTAAARGRGDGGRAAAAETADGRARLTRRSAPPLEHRVLMTATLLLLAYGAVMVYSASSPLGVVDGHGLGTGEFLMYLFAAVIGLVAMRIFERHGLGIITERLVRFALIGSFLLLLAVLVPHIGVEAGGARRWLGAGPLQFQPSEVMKLALVLYVARYLAENPRRLQRGIKPALAPVAIVVLPACALIYIEPDLGTALVVLLTVGAMLFAAGIPSRYLVTVVGVAVFLGLVLILSSSYQRERLTSFLHPSTCAQTTCFQSVQGQISVGSGGLFGVGLGQGVQKDFYLPEAQTDFILAVIGEELGVVGIIGLVVLYGMIAYAGLRTARKAATRYAKLVATGLTSLILCQAILNIFVVLGIAPLTGVPLPFISYAPSSLVVLLASVGLLLNIARPSARELKAVRGETTSGRDRSRGNGRTRGAGTGSRRRAAS
jgi:cell division protein FtsW